MKRNFALILVMMLLVSMFPAAALAANAAPTVKDITLVSNIMGKYYRVSFNEDEDVVEAFLEGINNVSVNDNKVNRVHTFFNDTNAYKIANDPVYGGAYVYLDLTLDCLEGPVVVTIDSDNYDQLYFVAEDGELIVYKGLLEELLIACEENLFEEDYTENSWANYLDALATATEVYNDPNATQADVDGAIIHLMANIEALVPVIPATGDSSNAAMMSVITLLAGAAFVAVLMKKRSIA